MDEEELSFTERMRRLINRQDRRWKDEAYAKRDAAHTGFLENFTHVEDFDGKGNDLVQGDDGGIRILGQDGALELADLSKRELRGMGFTRKEASAHKSFTKECKKDPSLVMQGFEQLVQDRQPVSPFADEQAAREEVAAAAIGVEPQQQESPLSALSAGLRAEALAAGQSVLAGAAANARRQVEEAMAPPQVRADAPSTTDPQQQGQRPPSSREL